MTTHFHFLRHASHHHLGRVLTGRLPGVPLSPAGRAEARALARHVAAVGIDALYTSPRLRACQTAEYVARETGVTCEVAEELDEIDFGRWSGTSFEALSRDAEWRRWNEERDTASTPAGESMREVAARLVRLVERLRRMFPGGSVALVSHSDVIKAGICHYSEKPFRHVHAFAIGPGSVTTLGVDSRGGRLVACNVRPLQLDEVPA